MNKKELFDLIRQNRIIIQFPLHKIVKPQQYEPLDRCELNTTTIWTNIKENNCNNKSNLFDLVSPNNPKNDLILEVDGYKSKYLNSEALLKLINDNTFKIKIYDSEDEE